MLRVTRQVVFGAGVAAVAGLAAVFGLYGSALAEPSSATPQVAANLPATAPVATDASAPTHSERKHMLMQYCTACHNDKLKTAGMSVVPLDADNIQANQATWEKILRRLSLGEMPPRGMPRPPKEQITDFTHWLATSLDNDAAAHPNPGRATVRRMARYSPHSRSRVRARACWSWWSFVIASPRSAPSSAPSGVAPAPTPA